MLIVSVKEGGLVWGRFCWFQQGVFRQEQGKRMDLGWDVDPNEFYNRE
jgi:hypothetical protein